MIEQSARIERIEGPHAWVVCEPASCRACDEGRGCGGGIFARLFAGGSMRFRVANALDARPGERVVLGMDERRLLGAATRLYGLPLAAMLAGALAGAGLAGADNDWMVLGGAILGLTLSLVRERRRVAGAPEPVLLRRCLSSG